MMLKNNVKKGQAAIEFLMTYGWMLLVVLIVGALIFSFVDFGSLLPNKLDLSNNLRASATESFASDITDIVTVVFSYTGSKSVRMNATKSLITSELGTKCESVSLRNADLGVGSTFAVGSGYQDPVTFLNGQVGVMEFNCSSSAPINGPGLLEGDVLEGKITMFVENLKTGIQTPSSGPIRIAITE